MTSATDIITYIGIPLAVLGVLPILYTFVLSILTQRRIRHRLIAHGHRPQTNARSDRGEGFVLRASPMTSLIEVEMPRYTIAPMERGDDKYWVVSREARGIYSGGVGQDTRLLRADSGDLPHQHGREQTFDRVESTLSMLEEGRVRGFLRGGSWRAFHWKKLVVGRKLYRIQYEDELREPPAEIEFANLVNFLLDWGAELDEMGWEKLRSGGLWTPSGTRLLKVGHTHGDGGNDHMENKPETPANEWVLRTSMPDDSDGILTLCVRWPLGQSFGSARNATSLPPGWGRLRRPKMVDVDDRQDEKRGTGKDMVVTTSASHGERKDLSSVITGLMQKVNTSFQQSTSVRFTLSSNSINQVYSEINNREIDITRPLSLSWLIQFSLGKQWFSMATTSLLTLNQSSAVGALWGFTPDLDILAFTRKDTIPCGVLVLLQLLDQAAAPQWQDSFASDHDDYNNPSRVHLRQFQARQAAQRLEATMPPDQASVHRRNREAEEMRQQSEAMMAWLNTQRTKEQKRIQDALLSPRLGCVKVAQACHAWLVEMGYIPAEWTMAGVAEAALWMIVVQSQSYSHSQTQSKRPSKEPGAENDILTHDDDVDNSDDSNNKGELPPPPPPPTGTTPDHDRVAILHILDAWMNWSLAGGMTRDQFDLLVQHKRDFCLAACLVVVIHRAAAMASSSSSSSSSSIGGAGGRGGIAKASVDMLECVRLWPKVRLG